MKKILIVLLVSAPLLWGCGGGGNSTAPAADNTPTVTMGEPTGGGLVPITFTSPLIYDQPAMEPAKVVGLMDQAIQISDVIKICWEGDIAGWQQENYCSVGSLQQGNNFLGTISVPVGDEGNLVAYLIQTEKGSVSWFNITLWDWPQGTIIDLTRGTIRLPLS